MLKIKFYIEFKELFVASENNLSYASNVVN